MSFLVFDAIADMLSTIAALQAGGSVPQGGNFAIRPVGRRRRRHGSLVWLSASGRGASVNLSFTVPSGTTRVRHRTKAEFALAWFGNGQSRIPCHVCPGSCWAEPPIMEGPKTDGASGMNPRRGSPFFNDLADGRAFEADYCMSRSLRSAH